jgi:D-lactate dehydrogenase
VRRIGYAAELRVVVFGHAADGNLHVHLFHERESKGDRARFQATVGAVYAEAIRLGGTVTAEHGVGLTSRDYLPVLRSPAYLEVLRAIKSALDPNGILNPGKLLRP